MAHLIRWTSDRRNKASICTCRDLECSCYSLMITFRFNFSLTAVNGCPFELKAYNCACCLLRMVRYLAMWLWDIENRDTTDRKNNSIEHQLRRCWGRVRPNSMFIDIFPKSTWTDVSNAVCNTRVRSHLLPQITLESIVLNWFWFKTDCFVVYLVSLESSCQGQSNPYLAIAIIHIQIAKDCERGLWFFHLLR